MDRISWKEWFGMLLVICGAIVAVDIYFETHYIGATARFLWNMLAFAMQSIARTLEAGLAILLRKRATRIFTGIFTAIGLVYVSHLILTDTQARKTHTWLEWVRHVVRVGASHLRVAWLWLPLWGKFVVVGVMIYTQIHLMPWVAALLVLFPIAFMVPVLVAIRQAITSWIVDSFFGQWYWRKFGRTHRATTTRLKQVPVARQVRGVLWLVRLQYLTAWRMWKHAPCYRMAKSERRRISLFEPLRLWWRGELSQYVGRPLLSGKNAPWPLRTYVPPTLWYDHETPRAQLMRIVMTALAMFFLVFTGRGSVRRH